MSEENTKEFDNARAFEQRVFARFDSIETLLQSFALRFENVESRLDNLEEQNSNLAKDTKPMHEETRALIAETREEMRAGFAKIEKKIDHEMRIVHEDRRRAVVEVEDLKDRVGQLERKPS